MFNEHRPRLSIEITLQQANDLRELIPWGLKHQVFSAIVDDVIRLARKHGPDFLSAILARAIKVEDYSVKMKEK